MVNNVEPSIIARVAGNVATGVGLCLLVGWGVCSVYLNITKAKDKHLKDAKQKTK